MNNVIMHSIKRMRRLIRQSNLRSFATYSKVFDIGFQILNRDHSAIKYADSKYRNLYFNKSLIYLCETMKYIKNEIPDIVYYGSGAEFFLEILPESTIFIQVIFV